MKKVLYSIIALIFTFQLTKAESISMVINGNIVTKTDIQNMTKIMLLQAQIPITQKNINKFESIAKNEFINQYIKGRIANRYGIEIDDTTLDRYMKEIAKRQNKTIDEYYIPYHRKKVSIKMLFEIKRIELLWQIYVNEILANNTDYDKGELNHYISNIKGQKLRNISIINISGKDAYKTANNLSQELRQKKISFEKMAKLYSSDISALNGGKIGWVKKGEQVKKIDLIVWSIPVGEISNSIKLNSSYVIIKINSQKIEDGKNTELLKTQYLEKLLYQTAKQKIEAERNNMEIEYK